jgi:PmbA protein
VDGEKMELAEFAIKKALELNATEAEVYVQRARTVSIEFDTEIRNLKTIESLGLSLRVALGKRIAMFSTSILNDKQIGEAVAKAVKIAKVTPEDPNWKHINKKFGKSSAKGYYDGNLESLDYEEIVKALNSSVKLIRDYDRRVELTRGILTILVSNLLVANSYNESAERKETNIEVWIRTKAEDSGMESTGNEHQETRYWKEINLDNLATNATQKAISFLKAKLIPSVKTSAIFKNKVFASIFGVILGFPITADWIQKGKSPLSNRLGDQIASENISIYDDGVMPGGWKTKPFDDEGHQTQMTPVIEKGILKHYLYDTYTSLKDNVESTGNAQRPVYWMKPQTLPNNLTLKAGNSSHDEIIRETKHGIYIEETIGEWLSNPVSGNLNATVSHGYLIENGELTKPIKGVVISGNFYDILKNGVEIIGKDLENNSEIYSPTVKISELMFAGE